MYKTSDSDIQSLCIKKDLTFISRFIKNEQTYVRCICDKHYQPYEFEISYRNLKNLKHSCPKCSGKNLSTQDIIYKISQINDTVEIIGEYVNMKTPILTRCKLCNNVWNANVVSLCQGSGCKLCKKSKPKKEHEEFVAQLKKVQPNLDVISVYNGDKNLITYKCSIDGYIGEAKAGNLLSLNTKCTCCSRKKLHDKQCISQEEFIERLKIANPNILPLDLYYNYNTKMKFVCLKHNTYFEQLTSSALQGKCGCSKCASSKGEKEIEMILKILNIDYLTQFRFNDCVDKKPLPFDFYLPNYNMTIEYQGEQHYKPVCFHSISKQQANFNLLKVQEHDKIKRDYCFNHNIQLLEIPYWDFENIKTILKEKLCI